MMKYIFLIFLLVSCSSLETRKNEKNYQILKALNYYSINEKSEALKIYKSILKKDPQNIDIMRECGVITAQLGEIDQSKKYFKKILEIDPIDKIALKNMAFIEFLEKKYESSERYLKKIPYDQLEEREYIMLGYISYRDKRYSEAIQFYRNSKSELLFKEGIIFKSYFESLKNTSSKAQMELEIEKATEYNLDKTSTLIIAEFYISSNKLLEAEKILKLYLSRNNLDNNILEKLVYIYQKLGMEDQEKSVFKLIIT